MTVTYSVSGMSCGHCESAVTKEVTTIPAVTSVTAVAKTGLLTIASEQPLAAPWSWANCTRRRRVQ